jgi:hypothetical protein
MKLDREPGGSSMLCYEANEDNCEGTEHTCFGAGYPGEGKLSDDAEDIVRHLQLELARLIVELVHVEVGTLCEDDLLVSASAVEVADDGVSDRSRLLHGEGIHEHVRSGGHGGQRVTRGPFGLSTVDCGRSGFVSSSLVVRSETRADRTLPRRSNEAPESSEFTLEASTVLRNAKELKT